MIRAVFFDFDDTLFDDKYCRRCCLEALRKWHPDLESIDIDILEKTHEQLLQSNYGRVLSGELSNADAIMSRMFGLFGSAGIALSMEQARIAADLYNEH